MPKWLMHFVWGLAFSTGFMAIQGFLAMACQSKWMTQNFIAVKVIHLVLLISIFVIVFVNLIRFEALSSFGDGGYVNATWSRILKFINMKEFDYGLIACTGGKYKQDTQISAIFEEVECPVWKNYEGMTKRDFVANLWELKGQGVVGDDEFVYGCLNEECADSLKSGLAG